MTEGIILDLFAGPGGWSEGLRMLGMEDVGIEWDDAACRTRAAAGHATIRADVAQYPTAPFVGKVNGLIASPPCQDFSMAGKRAGRTGDRGELIDQVPRWVDALRPEWVACEQVPPALEVWEEFAQLFRSWGYSAWCGILNAADYGVPQIRRRAVLIASRVGPALPPERTHSKDPVPTLFSSVVKPHVTMAQALGWGLSERPAYTFCGSNEGGPDLAGGSGARAAIKAAQTDGAWAWERPATVVCADPRLSPPGFRGRPDDYAADGTYTGARSMDKAIKLTVAEALTLQSFPVGYPVQGTKTKQFEQVGNAVPPLLAAHVVASLTGVSIGEGVAA